MRLVGFAYAGVEPELMGLGPVPATNKVLEQTGISLDDVGLFELNEPFAVQVLTWCDGVGVAPDDPRLNPYGGAIACGHPLAATGVRLMAQLARGFRDRPDVRYGLTALCIGLGMGAAILWENVAERRPWLAPRPSSSSSGSRPRVGPVALVTMDNGEDWQKPNTFGEQALRSLDEVLGRLRTRDWRGLLLTGKPFVFAVGADIDQFGEITPERAREGGQAGHELFGRLRDLPFITLAADQRRGARRRRRDRAPLRLPDDLLVRTPLRLPRGVPRAHPRLGRDAAHPQARRRRAGGEVHRRESRSARTACSRARRRSSRASPTPCSSRSSSSTSRSRSCSRRSRKVAARCGPKPISRTSAR